MNETIRTAAFAVVAAAALLFAWWAAPTSATRSPDRQVSKVGEEFFPNFTNPNEATGLRVVNYDEVLSRPRDFKVEFRDGLWTIPTHNNYPADAQTRLGKTASSLLGVKREELRSVNPADQAELGVLDPEGPGESGKKGMGQKVILTKGDETLLDLIVGKPVKGRPGYYYVRRSDEKNATYVAKLDNVDFSTKFSDWIENDLLKIESDDLTGVVMNNYSVDELKGPVKGDINELSREKGSDPWTLKGINAAKEELDTSRTSQMVDALDNLKLVGVRRKPAGLSQTLKVGKEGTLKREDVRDLDEKGFQLADGDLYSKYGEFTATTNKGAVYTLRFGDTVFGGEEAVESGKGVKSEKNKKDEKAAAASAQPPRNLFITVQFDEKYVTPKLPTKPTAPVKPVPPKPAGDKPAEPAKPADTKPADAKTPGKPGEKAAEKPAEKAPAKANDKPPEKAAAKPEPAKPDPVAAAAEIKYQAELKKYEEDKKKYDEDLKKYEEDKTAHEKKVEEGKKFVKELNDRFADWYYVIPGEAYAQLRVSRKDLVKPKSATPPGGEGKSGKMPFDLNHGFPPMGDKPVIRPQDKPATPPEDKPAEKPATKPADKPAAKAPDVPADKPPEKPAAKASEKAPEKASEKSAAEKPASKPAEKSADKKSPDPVSEKKK